MMYLDIEKYAKTVHFNNKAKKTWHVSRQSFRSLLISIDPKDEWVKSVLEIAQRIEPNLNSSGANTNQERDQATKKNCNDAGLIAEYACYEFLKWIFGDAIEKPENAGSKNQIDINTNSLSGQKSQIEVRSSFVSNGIEFALFAKQKDDPDLQYFDVIGPYTTSYKPEEICKDFYMRVLFPFPRSEFDSHMEEGSTIDVYITGGVTKEMLCDKNEYQLKHLLPSGGEVEIESDYRVIPMCKSLDIKEFISAIKRASNMKVIKRKKLEVIEKDI